MADRDRTTVRCAWCDKEFNRAPSKLQNSKSGLFFCCREHKDIAQKIENGLSDIWPDHFNSGIRTYRAKALRHYSSICNRCGFNGDIRAIQVHHIDRDRRNGDINNLEVLCVRCHFLEHIDEIIDRHKEGMKKGHEVADVTN